jgi:LacI family transcriptional regulator
VATAAGVSITTASNVVNKKYGSMSADTRRRIEDVIADLKYRVNISGRSLRSSRGSSVAFVALDDDVPFLRDPFTAETVSGFANTISEKGFNPIVHRIDPSKIDQHSLFRRDEVVGLCMSLQGWARERQRAVDMVAALGLPIVIIDNTVPPKGDDICVVRQDDFGGAVMLANHVLQRGAKRILLVRPAVDWISMEEREAGMRTVFGSKAPGVQLDKIEIDHLSIAADVSLKLQAYLRQNGKPDAIMGGNDQIAAACINLVKSMGMRVPEDLIVTGFNGFDVFDLLPYRITTVQSAAYDLGVRGALELDYRIRTGHFRMPEIILSVSLRQGNTT